MSLSVIVVSVYGVRTNCSMHAGELVRGTCVCSGLNLRD